MLVRLSYYKAALARLEEEIEVASRLKPTCSF